MGNALLFAACLLGAAALGGFVGSCCSKGRQAGGHEGRIAELEDRLDALADHAMDELHGLKARTADLENQFEEMRIWMGDIDAKVEDAGSRLDNVELWSGAKAKPEGEGAMQ